MRTETFPRFFTLSAIVHVGIAWALYYTGWLNPVSSGPAPRGFDAARVTAVMERMRTAEAYPVDIPAAKPVEAPETPKAPVEAVVTERYVPPPKGSLAPKNLNEILDRSLGSESGDPAPRKDKTSGSATEGPDAGDLEEAWKEAASVEEGKVQRSKMTSGKGSVATGGFVIGGKGEVARSAVELALSKRLPQMQNCYQAALLENPSLSGKVLLRWTVSKSGEVEQVLIENSQLENAELHSCIVQEIAKTRFPTPEGGSVIIRYPLTFSVQSY